MGLISRLIPGRDDAEAETETKRADVELDTLLNALSVERRRLVLRHLVGAEGTLTKGALADLVAADEQGVPIKAVDSTDRKAVYVALHQCHLDVLDEAGLIVYEDPDVRATPAAETALDVLHHAAEMTGGAD